VVGSGPGGLQLSYSLTRLGVDHALISDDSAAGGMFRRWPVFQRMLSWTKPFTPFDQTSREYERFDWNSLVADEDQHRAVMPGLMDGTSYFPSRPEMQRGLETFADRTRIRVRYDCCWESTAREGQDFVLVTSDGEFRAPVIVFAVGVAQPWRPPIPGLDDVPHYGDLRPVETYAGRRLFIIGKQNSGFEIASGLLHWARQIVLASPSPTKLSLNTHSLVGVRARYLQPYEDHVLAGGVLLLNASIEEVVKQTSGYRVRTRGADGAEVVVDVDDVIAATGFTAPLRDLPDLGVATFGQSKLPAQTPFWESATVPNLFFAGTITQGAGGLKKHGIPSNSGAVLGHRYNARVLARHLAENHFGVTRLRSRMKADAIVPHLLAEATRGPELWHQHSYLCRVIVIDGAGEVLDDGLTPLAHFVDAAGPDAVAMTLESDGKNDNLYPVAYVRHDGQLTEHALPPNPLLQFEGAEYADALHAALKPILT
jgi:thioredoxin reductase